MADDYWLEHRAEYAALNLFSALAVEQLEDALAELAQLDPVKRGIQLETGEPHFEKLMGLAVERFPGHGPFDRVSLEPHPWKSPGRWQLRASGARSCIEGYVSTDDVEKHLETKEKPDGR